MSRQSMQDAGKPMRHPVMTWSDDRDAGTLPCVQITLRVDLARALAGPT